MRLALFSFPLEGYVAIPAYHADLLCRTDDGPALRADIFDSAVLGFLTLLLARASFREAAGVDRLVAEGFLDPCLRLLGSVVIVQPYFWCFSIRRPCASAVALNFIL